LLHSMVATVHSNLSYSAFVYMKDSLKGPFQSGAGSVWDVYDTMESPVHHA